MSVYSSSRSTIGPLEILGRLLGGGALMKACAVIGYEATNVSNQSKPGHIVIASALDVLAMYSGYGAVKLLSGLTNRN